MKTTRALFGALCVVLSLARAAVAEEPMIVITVPVDPTAVVAPSKSHLLHEDPYCLPCCYGYNRLAVPYEIVARLGPSFDIGGNNLDEILRTGYAFQVAARGFCYDELRTSAWTAELAIAAIIADGDKNREAQRRLNDVTIEGRFGQPLDTEVDSRYAVLRISRVYVQAAGGYECYWYGEDPCGYRCAVGIDAGLRAGHAKAQIRAIRRIFTPALGPNDVVNDRDSWHDTDITYGMFAALNTFVIYPCWGYDVTLGLRTELGRDWMALVDGDDTLDHVTILLTAGLRY